MKKVITTEKIPIKLWLDELDEDTLKQAKNLANLPFAFKHVSIMPDSHVGFGMPIGGVFAAKDYVIPNAVGVDIGCGMCAVKTSLTSIEAETLKKVMSRIRELIPVGMKHHQRKQDESLMPDEETKGTIIVDEEYENALTQVGTLGGGNHFIEIQRDREGFLWMMVHSGSRNIGFKAAAYYNKLATQLNERWKTGVPKEWQLAFLPIDSDEGTQYLREMNYCIKFALANRKLMIERVKEALESVITGGIKYEPLINIPHNYAAVEKHFGHNVVVHRKGATSAQDGETGIIPGSQGTKSYIVKGKGNRESFTSCSHGAGRKLGRNQAINTLSFNEEKEKLDRLGIIHALRSKSSLDEAPGAYKDIDMVMRNQEDLVDILVELSPLAVVKG
ncbi:MAG: RtcB family protein [Ignavibacteriaceae bacterium]|nr:RtcB family protein [Ignavibacteriaceae bacterium]